jgi:asparagine synthase (glutamine-hydrolysing)
MCGIAGIVAREGQPVDGRPLSAMLESIAHRGPDGSGTIYRTQLAMGARRLAIVDPLHGAQPFWSDDGAVVAVMNGEIFNHDQLRKDLAAAGFRPRTRCDAELVPFLYQLYGPTFVDRINGQFAIALYDFSRRSFFAWRDPFGICPLFWTERNSILIFASEIKALLRHAQVRPVLDPVGLDQILTFPGPVSPQTLFESIWSLPPGHRLEAREGQPCHVAPYWDLAFSPTEEGRSDESLAEEFEQLLFDAVKLRAASDVPTALYLSGGLDSSLVSAMLRRVLPEADLDAFSIDFEDKLVSEAEYQRLMVEAIGANGHVAKLGAEEVWRKLDQVVWHTETPLRETFNVASLSLSEMARAAGHKVVLAGQGADELFAGYVGYRFDARSRGAVSSGVNAEGEINRALWGNENFVYERRYGAFARVRQSLYSAHLRERFADFDCTSRPLLPEAPPSAWSVLQRRSYIDCKLRLADHLLSGHGDRMAMASGVEVRYPFLDRHIGEFAARLPDRLKLSGLTEKFIVKQAGSRWLPPEIVNREKFGFTAPGSPVLLRLPHDRIQDLLSDERIARQNVFDVAEVQRLKARYSRAGFRIAVPFETDLLITVITYGLFSELFSIPDL